ncbi:MAG: hypothetical protein B0D92_03105 [Spirochaeta sp. LUC14_002_19_P3]|nr:MAG: hypothetical protein B0D92_03105 [Spirochaeta sp. LUC14_002_19_P3]
MRTVPLESPASVFRVRWQAYHENGGNAQKILKICNSGTVPPTEAPEILIVRGAFEKDQPIQA